jgi:hypothetical protein
MGIFNDWNKMVFPQAEFEIVPDSQAASPSGEGSISAHSANPKNPNVANVLRMLSLETVDDSDTELESETLPINTAGNNEDNWGLDDTNSDHASDIRVYNDDDYDYILQESQDPTITPSHSAVYGAPGSKCYLGNLCPIIIYHHQHHRDCLYIRPYLAATTRC